jgi:hypothetical protein
MLNETGQLKLRRLALACTIAVVAQLSCGQERPRPSRYGAMFDEIRDHVWAHGYDQGAWDPHWGDAPYYGPAFYAALGFGEGLRAEQERAQEAVAYNVALAETARSDAFGEFLRNANHVIYGTLGIIDYMAWSNDRAPLETVDAVVAVAGTLMGVMGYYLQDLDNNPAQVYGPTSITAIVAILYLQHAVLLQTDQAEDYIDQGRHIIARVDEVAWNGTFYQFDADNEGQLFLYPNVAMMMALLRAHEATGEEAFLSRAEEVYWAVQELRCADRPGYRSPYSAEVMGAQTDDYTTLSSTNYTMLALALMYQQTGEERYRDEIHELLGFVEDYLWLPTEGRAVHHWIDGRRVESSDGNHYCIGCNLQLLYIIQWIHDRLG